MALPLNPKIQNSIKINGFEKFRHSSLTPTPTYDNIVFAEENMTTSWD